VERLFLRMKWRFALIKRAFSLRLADWHGGWQFMVS
jgi:hypothetical protein